MGRGLLPSVILGLIIHALINCHPRAQFFGPRAGSRSFAAGDSYSEGVNFGPLGVSNTLSDTRAYSNGRYSGGVSHELGLGPLGIGTSLSSDRNEFGLRQNSDGGLGVGLGPLEFDIGQNHGVFAQTGAAATGDYANAQTQSGSRGLNFGLLGLSSAFSNSRATGISGRPAYYGRRKRSEDVPNTPLKQSPDGSTADDSQEKLNVLPWPALKMNLFGKNILSQADPIEKTSENLMNNEPIEKRTFGSIFDFIIRMIAPTFALASQVLVPFSPNIPQVPGITPVSCCSSCFGPSACQPGTVNIPGPYPAYTPVYAPGYSPGYSPGYTPGYTPGVNVYYPSNQGTGGNGISYTSSSSSSSVGSGGPITVYSSSNSQSGIQAG